MPAQSTNQSTHILSLAMPAAHNLITTVLYFIIASDIDVSDKPQTTGDIPNSIIFPHPWA